MGKSLEQIDHAFKDFSGNEEREVMEEAWGGVLASGGVITSGKQFEA